MKLGRLALVTSSLLALSSSGVSAHHGNLTMSEWAAEICEETDVLNEFGDGHFETCYWNMLHEGHSLHQSQVRLTPPVTLERYEDGSGAMYEGTLKVMSFPENTFPWDCETQGNRQCGPVELVELPHTT